MTHDQHEREANEAKVWELFDAGESVEAISSELGISIDLVEAILGNDPEEYPEDEDDFYVPDSMMEADYLGAYNPLEDTDWSY